MPNPTGIDYSETVENDSKIGDAQAARNAVAALVRDSGRLLRYQRKIDLRNLAIADELLRAPAANTNKPTAQAANIPGPSKPAQPAIVAVAVAVAPPATAQRIDQAQSTLHIIQEEIGPACQRCNLHEKRTHIVFGVGNPAARLMFVGEAPGRDEDLQGEPFVGAAGQLLDKMIVAMGTKRSEIYLANICKCRPPRNRDPLPEEVLACEPFLIKQIQAIAPDAIVALGRYACQTLLRDSSAISKMRGQWRDYEGIPLMPTFHPAYLLRNPSAKKQVWQDLQQVMGKLGLRDPRAK